MAHDPIREAIREAYQNANGDRAVFLRLVEDDNRVKFLSIVTIAAIIFYACQLWKLWHDKGVHNPSEEDFKLLNWGPQL